MAIDQITPVGAASPEQNALLALRLFQPVTDSMANGASNRTAVLLRLAEARNQAASQQALLAQQQRGQVDLENMRNSNSVTLEGLRAQNSQSLAQREYDLRRQEDADMLDRQLAVTKQQQDALDKRDLNKQFSLNYPVYAQANAVLGKTPAPLSTYDYSWKGLGQLQADMKTLGEEATKHERSAGAQGVLAILDQSTAQLEGAIKARDKIAQITPEDESSARSRGVAALTAAAQNGTIPGLDPKSDKFKSAIDALNKDQPDLTVASQILGPTGIQVYANGVHQGLQLLQNDKNRIARIADASRQITAAQRGASENLTRLTALTANNPELGEALAARNSRLQSVQSRADTSTSAPPPDTQSIFTRLTGVPPPAGAAAPGGVPAPGAPAPTGNPQLDAYNLQQSQQQRDAQIQNAMQRLQALRATAGNQGAALGGATAVPPYSPAGLGLGIAMGGGPFSPAIASRAPSRLAANLSQTLNQQSQAQTDYDALAQVLAGAPGPAAGAGNGFQQAPPFRLSPNPLEDQGFGDNE